MKRSVLYILISLLVIAAVLCTISSAVTSQQQSTKTIAGTINDTVSSNTTVTATITGNGTTTKSLTPNITVKIKPTKTVATTAVKTPKATIVKNVTTKVSGQKNKTPTTVSQTKNPEAQPAVSNVNGYFLFTCNTEGAQVSLTDANGLATPVGTIKNGQLIVPVDNNAAQFKGFTISAPDYSTFTGVITTYPVNGGTIILEGRLNYTGGKRDEYFSVSGDVQGGSTISNINVITTGAGGCCG